MGKVVALEDDGATLVVEVSDELRRWGKTSARPIARARAPRGMANPNARQLEAARLVAEGMPRREVALKMGVTIGLLADWPKTVREAVEDARHLAAAE